MKITLCLIAVLFCALLVAAPAHAQSGTLALSCNPCAVNQGITINGTGFPSGNKTLVVVVVGSPTPVSCTTPDKLGKFTCTTSVPLAGTFDVPAFWHNNVGGSWTEFADTSVVVQ